MIIEYFIKNLVFLALVAITFLCFRLILVKSKFQGKGNGNILKYPLGYRLAPLVTVGFFAVVAALVGLFAEEDVLYVIASGIVAFGGLLVSLSWSLWRVEISEDGFTYTNCFGKKRRYVYANLEHKQAYSDPKWHFYQGEIKVLTMPLFIQNRDKLLSAYYHYKNKHK
ncbi:MAG: hypothetical protein E7350_03140 [Clostridiales bacterium]|nr:hypothetical protein [Clostridiales bacterium]